jgi:hypothetical protein
MFSVSDGLMSPFKSYGQGYGGASSLPTQGVSVVSEAKIRDYGLSLSLMCLRRGLDNLDLDSGLHQCL